MAHHAYFVSGDLESGIASALRFAKKTYALPEESPDAVVLRYGLLSVDDARTIKEMAERAPLAGDTKLLVVAAGRIFHEAQNALLKLLEEPPTGVVIVLIVPSAGVLLSTLRSRLLPLPLQGKKETASSELIETFLQGKKDAREKVVAKLLERAKSDKDQEKQAARLEALTLAEALALQAYAQAEDENGLGEYHAFLQDLHTFIPILSERSAPLKPIFEHILLTIPAGLGRT